ncbi:MAG TPA: hypothetical protein VKP67_10785 [Xanthobacteraceae bacterium]|nr:hypothetical protein [Xanthobacteraceae bacterium]
MSHAYAVDSRHEFDRLEVPARPRIRLHRATNADIGVARQMAAQEIPGAIASEQAIARTITQNRNSVLLFYKNAEVVGIWAMLMLTAIGLEALLLGEFDGLNPNPNGIAATGDSPAAIYHWAVVAPGLASEGIRHVGPFLRQPPYRGANFYSRPATDVGIRLNLGLGFRPIAAGTPGLFRYVRLINRASPVSSPVSHAA